MKLFFSPVDVNSELGGFITSTPNVLYQHYVEYGSGPGGLLDFTIADAVGRFVPISISDIDALIVSLNEVRDIATQYHLSKAIEEQITNPDTHSFLNT